MGFEVPPRERLEPLCRILFKPYVAECFQIDFLVRIAANTTVFMGVFRPFAAKHIGTNQQSVILKNVSN